MTDYSFDSRGDVGSWIRDASMEGLRLAFAIAKDSRVSITLEQRQDMIGFIIGCCFEKIDRIRETAGKVLCELLDDGDILIPDRKFIELAVKR
jgi:hypothetical protein